MSWLVQETVAKFVEKGHNVYISMIDTQKAFDSVWQNGLFYILYKAGLDGKCWRILCQFYKRFICYVRVGKCLSEGFEALQGIHQGAPCSMLMFQIFKSKMLEQLSQCIFALNMYGIRFCSPAFADELTVIALSKEGLQAMLNIIHKHSFKWRIDFNPKKCSIMVFGDKKELDRKYVFKLGKEIVNQTRNEILLGTIVANSIVELQMCVKKRIDISKCMLYAAQSIDSYTLPVNPIVATKIYWEACIPKLLYGLEITDIDENTMIDLDIFHFKVAKHCQWPPTNTLNYGALFTIGWRTLSAQCEKIRLMFMWRLL